MKILVKIIAYPVMMLSAVGVFLCLSFCFLGLAGIYLFPTKEMPVLFVGIFVVWLPTVILMNRLTKDFKQKDLWKAALRGCPRWMRGALWAVLGCVFAVFFLPVFFKRSPGDLPQTFVLFPIMFYAISFCFMYSLISVENNEANSRCLNGHDVSPLAKFCGECGAAATSDSKISTAT